MPTFVAVMDTFNDVHAREVIGEANSAAIHSVAIELCKDTAGIDEDFSVSVGVVSARDAGAARASLEGITWLYNLNPRTGEKLE